MFEGLVFVKLQMEFRGCVRRMRSDFMQYRSIQNFEHDWHRPNDMVFFKGKIRSFLEWKYTKQNRDIT